MSALPLAGIVVALALLVAPCIRQQRPLLIWNASPSVAVGLYRVDQVMHRVGDLVALRLHPPIAALAARRGYLPHSAYLLKPIVAIEGDRVCRLGAYISIRRRLVTFARPADSMGRALPSWHGCRTLKTGQVFVLADHPASFDSRYFGPLDANSIVGCAVLFWHHRPAS